MEPYRSSDIVRPLLLQGSIGLSCIVNYLITVRGGVDVEVLKQAVWTLFQQHDSLRLEFDDAGAKSWAHNAGAPCISERVEMYECEDADQEARRLLERRQRGEDPHSNTPVI
jgi:hypothetical protein